MASRVALVTGAAQGIGLATVRQLLQSGAKVGLVDISNQLDKTCDVLRDEFGSKSVLSMPCDVTDDKSLRGVFEKTIDEFGSLDIVVNNAGIVDEENWRKMIQINVNAVISGTHHALELMSPNAGGVIVNVSSVAGIQPVPFLPIYATTKHGVIGFTRSMKDHVFQFLINLYWQFL
jgi:15-hydroxyprostaglandin dehydrogenase (NAD)